ncbi:hypothetical protein MMC19_002440 [Ptychographa xylographoides]|nr:hypothetical protein [Ptychographa xylographoides]
MAASSVAGGGPSLAVDTTSPTSRVIVTATGSPTLGGSGSISAASDDASVIHIITVNGATSFTLVPNPLFTASPNPAISNPTITTTAAPTAQVIAASSTSSPSALSSDTSSNTGLSFGAKMAAILVPILVLLALVPIVYMFCLHRRNKRRRSELPELYVPTETRLLEQPTSRHNSISLPSPFSDKERVRNTDSLGMFGHSDTKYQRAPSPRDPVDSMGTFDRPDSEVQRAPSPTLPSPSMPVFRTQEAWPLTAPLPEPPPAYGSHNPVMAHNPTLRPPSSNYGQPSSQARSPGFLEVNMSSHDLGVPSRHRDSDAVSEMSFEQGSGRRRSRRDSDEVSFVSALSPNDAPPSHSHQLF